MLSENGRSHYHSIRCGHLSRTVPLVFQLNQYHKSLPRTEVQVLSRVDSSHCHCLDDPKFQTVSRLIPGGSSTPTSMLLMPCLEGGVVSPFLRTVKQMKWNIFSKNKFETLNFEDSRFVITNPRFFMFLSKFQAFSRPGIVKCKIFNVVNIFQVG